MKSAGIRYAIERMGLDGCRVCGGVTDREADVRDELRCDCAEQTDHLVAKAYGLVTKAGGGRPDGDITERLAP